MKNKNYHVLVMSENIVFSYNKTSQKIGFWHDDCHTELSDIIGALEKALDEAKTELYKRKAG